MSLVFLRFLLGGPPKKLFEGSICAMVGGPWPKYAVWGGGIIVAWTYGIGGGGVLVIMAAIAAFSSERLFTISPSLDSLVEARSAKDVMTVTIKSSSLSCERNAEP